MWCQYMRVYLSLIYTENNDTTLTCSLCCIDDFLRYKSAATKLRMNFIVQLLEKNQNFWRLKVKYRMVFCNWLKHSFKWLLLAFNFITDNNFVFIQTFFNISLVSISYRTFNTKTKTITFSWKLRTSLIPNWLNIKWKKL